MTPITREFAQMASQIRVALKSASLSKEDTYDEVVDLLAEFEDKLDTLCEYSAVGPNGTSIFNDNDDDEDLPW